MSLMVLLHSSCVSKFPSATRRIAAARSVSGFIKAWLSIAAIATPKTTPKMSILTPVGTPSDTSNTLLSTHTMPNDAITVTIAPSAAAEENLNWKPAISFPSFLFMFSPPYSRGRAW